MNIISEIGKWLHLIFGLSLLHFSEEDDAFVEDMISSRPLLVPNI